MHWLLFIVCFFIGGFFGVLAMALAAASKDRDDFWAVYERGYADGVRSNASLN